MTADLEPAEVLNCPDGSVECIYRVPRDYAGFDGHFPGDLVLPGMCHVDLALRTIRIATGARCELAAIVRARFLRKVRPGEVLRIVVRPEPGHPDRRRWSARHSVGDEHAADIVVDVTSAVAPAAP